MRMPKVNDEVFVKSFGAKGRITGIEDDVVRIHFGGRGAPYKIHVSDLHLKNESTMGKFRIGVNIGVFKIEWETA